MKFAITENGFIENISFDKDNIKTVITYTNNLRNAKQFTTTNSVMKFLEKHELKGFAYNPWAEDPIRGMYEIIKTGGAYSFLHDDVQDDNKIFVPPVFYKVRRVVAAYNSDAKFIESRGVVKKEFYTFEEAKAEALRLNTLASERLEKLLGELKNLSESDRHLLF